MRGVSFPYMTKTTLIVPLLGRWQKERGQRRLSGTSLQPLPLRMRMTWLERPSRTLCHSKTHGSDGRRTVSGSTPAPHLSYSGNACAPRARLSPNRMVQILDDTSSMSTVSGRGHNGRLTHDLDVAGFSGRCRDNSHALNECAGTSVPAHPTFLVQSTG